MKKLLLLILPFFVFAQEYSLKFDGSDGNDYVEFENFEFGNFGLNDYTIAVDIFTNEIGGSYQRLVSKQQNFPPYNGWGLDITPNKNVRFMSGNSEFTTNGNLLSIQELENGKWYNISAVFNGSENNVSIYINGVLDNQVFGSPNGNPNNQEFLRFGVHNPNGAPSGPEFLIGSTIKNVKIWEQALTNEQIVQNISNNLSNDVNILGDWSYNNINQSVMWNYADSSNHGTIHGATWVQNIYGCTDQLACNYNENANISNDNCDYSCHDNGQYSLSFDGVDDYVDFGDLDIIDDNDFSVQFDLKTDDNDKSFLFSKVGVINQDGNEYPAYYFIVMLDDGTLQVELSDGYSGPGDYSLISGSTPINDNQWHNITVTFDRDDIASIYIDGSLDGSNQILSHPGSLNNSETLKVGGQSEKFLNGFIDNFRIWDIELSLDQVNQLINQDSSFNDPNTLVDWNFNSGQPYILDMSGGQNHGTINGATWVENIQGCTDELACNHNPDAHINDYSCDYSCHDNGYYSLSFESCFENCNYVLLSDANNFDVSGNQEISIFTEVTIDENQGQGGYIFNAEAKYGYSLLVEYGKINFVKHNNNTGVACITDNNYTDSDTYEIFINSNSSITNIYVDGILEKSCESTIIEPLYNEVELTIGSSDIINPSNFNFDGSIHELKLWNSVISQNEIDTFNTSVIADWRFGSGTDILYDHSGNGNHGAIHGATWECNDEVDCLGECGGVAVEDCAGECGGVAVEDCAGECGGSAEIDLCGECNGNGYDTCDDDGDGVSNLDQWGYGVHTVSVFDIPEDQGGRIHVQFNSSFYDTDPLSRSEMYTIERKDGDIWMAVQSVGAYGAEQYNAEVSTVNNNISTEIRIIANMDEGNFTSLETIQGISIDNIHPSTPDNLLASGQGNDINLSWRYVPDFDFNHHQVASLNSTLYTIDNEIDLSLTTYDEYFVHSVDINENLSDKSDDVSAHNLNDGMNLISFSILPQNSNVNNILSETDIISIIGEGQAASILPNGLWVGSLNSIVPSRGYWVKSESGQILTVVGQKEINTQYNLNSGNNLISYTCTNPGALSELITNENITSIIGEGVAASYNQALGRWIGSLSALAPGRGYWFKSSEATELSYDCPEDLIVSAREQEFEEIKNYIQSTEQAFYIFEDIENVEVGDRIESYCNNTLVGSRTWTGRYMDIPAMGQDSQEITQSYCQAGFIPSFKLIKSSGEVFDLYGNIPAWSSNEVYVVEDLTIEPLAPEAYSLSKAYPNPFNPSTTIDFSVPIESVVNIGIYDVSGRNIQMLVNDTYQPGYYSIVWNGAGHSSGVYFVKMTSGSYTQTQKLMMIK